MSWQVFLCTMSWQLSDRHLNIFYSYNQDNELIENNLTRAFIVTLSSITTETRNCLFHSLSDSFKFHDFSEAGFALQSSNIDPLNFERRYIVTLSSHRGFLWEHEYKELDKNIIRLTLETKCCPVGYQQNDLLQSLCYGSIPDAWIYDNNLRYCFLIECKKQGDCINYPQIIRHAYENYKLSDVEEIDKVTIKITWYDIVAGFKDIIRNKVTVNNQESAIISNFIEYLSFFGYYHFDGIQLDGLLPVPAFVFSSKLLSLFRFKELRPQPSGLSLLTGIKKLFEFNQMVTHASFQLTSDKEIK